ncbi:hypothetical protein [Nocardioides sp.]|uniref:hypothetical protein n=1 Tax=Nocardioides sp. TaxID=35761 RepID=UPI00271FC454|nr:hypothetical protein [Nocardioides sp.]MDO9455571.1 hypothetical protein [Nocardioides sp.]
MRVRVVVAVLLALVVGVAGGYAVAASREEPAAPGRSEFADPAPVPAADPSLPVREIAPDPTDPSLPSGLTLASQDLVAPGPDGKPSRARVTVPAPEDWARTFVAPVEPDAPARWQWKVPGNNENSYGLRLDVFRGRAITVDRAIGARQSAMRSAQADGNFADLTFEEEDDDGFLASYITDGYRRYSLERFFSGPDPTVAYATISVFGRAQDLDGMRNLLEKMSIGLRTG